MGQCRREVFIQKLMSVCLLRHVCGAGYLASADFIFELLLHLGRGRGGKALGKLGTTLGRNWLELTH